MPRKGLGKGLQALIPGPDLSDASRVREINLGMIAPNPSQPRRRFDSVKLEELVDSIKQHGVIQPIVVRKTEPGKYEIVAGERRVKASVMCGLKTIPAIIKEYNDVEMAEIALIENIQREDLDPLEEANAYSTLLEEFKYTQEGLAQRVGKNRSTIANMLRLLNLPKEVQRYLTEGKLTIGHAKALLAIENSSTLETVATKVVESGCSVRQTEALVKKIQQEPESIPEKSEAVRSKDPVDAALLEIEDRLRTMFKTQVKVKDSGERGKIEISYYSREELTQIIDVLLGEQ